MLAEEETNKVSFLSSFPFSFAMKARGKVSTQYKYAIKTNIKKEKIENDKNNNNSQAGSISTFKEKR